MKITPGQKQSAKYALAFLLGMSVAGSTTATESPAQSTEPSPSITEPTNLHSEWSDIFEDQSR